MYSFFLVIYNEHFIGSFFSEVLYLNVICCWGMCSTICAVLLKVINRSTRNLCEINSADFDFHRIGTSVFFTKFYHMFVFKCFQLPIKKMPKPGF